MFEADGEELQEGWLAGLDERDDLGAQALGEAAQEVEGDD